MNRLFIDMPKNNSYLSILFILYFGLFGYAQLDKDKGLIQGEVQIDTTVWESTVYLSYIPTFNYMSVISYDMIITAAKIDSTGHFKFDTSFLPEEQQLYRIHIPKKDTSPISLIIGGKEENHMFLIANKTSHITINSVSSISLFSDVSFSDNHVNSDFQKVINIVKSEDDIDFNTTLMQRKLIKESIKKELKAIAEKNQNPLVALYAIYKSDIDDSNIEDQQFIKTFDDKWHSEDNPYFNAYRNTYTMQSSNNYYLVFLSIGAFLLIMGYVFIYVFKKKKSSNNKKQLQSLSIQERKILGLIQQGLSNKEISDECHIELSTVKTHVSNIYSKLNIKSRKDAMGINS